jgi:hypothetical protein
MKGLVLKFALLSFLCTSLSLPAAQARVLSTEEFLGATERAAHLQTVNSVLAQESVRSQLIALGVDPADAAERVAQLSDQELAELAAQMEDLPAGGSVLALIGAVFLVLMILELTGVINIFNSF